MRMNFYFIFLFILFAPIVKSQTASIDFQAYRLRTTFLLCPAISSSHTEFFDKNRNLFQLSDDTEMKIISATVKENGWQHFKYQQIINKLPVFGAIYNLHEKEEIVQSANGLIYPMMEWPNQQEISLKNAQKAAIQSQLKSVSKGKFQTQNENLSITKSERNWIDPLFPKYSGYLRPAYHFVVEQTNPIQKKDVFIDAVSGHKIFEQSLICQVDVPSNAKTKYYGDQKITSDSIAPSEFYLRDNARGIVTYSDKPSGVVLYKNNNSKWDQVNVAMDEVALDAHYCATSFYDMMLSKFNYKGIDGKGGLIRPVVHLNNGADIVNAYWTGEFAFFGDGSCHYSPLTTLSIVAHEFTHGVTQYNSGLVYASESGALNESLSDIFGKACEYYFDHPNFNWDLDRRIKGTKYADLFRSMSDPNSLHMPKTYQGQYWDDMEEVHTNSGVLNYWFTLMIDGGTGMSENNTSYIVQPNSMQDVLNILFSCQQKYLTPTSNYNDMFTYTKEACKQLYGINSTIYNSLVQAWIAVGIEDQATPQEIIDLALSIENSSLSFCADGSPIEIYLGLTNAGNQIILAGTNVDVEIGDDISIPKENFTFTFQKDLLPGRTEKGISKKILLNMGPGSYFLFSKITFIDDSNSNNDESDVQLLLGNNSPGDLSVIYGEAHLIACKGSIFESNLYLQNNSCLAIPADTKFNLDKLLDGNVFLTKEATLNVNLEPGGIYTQTDTFSLPASSGMFSQIVNLTIDPNQSNNISDELDLKVKQINSPLALDFSNPVYDDFIYHSNIFGLDPILTLTNGNDVFATTGFPGVYEIPCLQNTRNFGSEIISTLNTCLDFSKNKSMKLSFDLNQYRADSLKFPELWDKTSLLELELTQAGVSQSVIIADQLEGKWINHEMNIPDKFNGDLRFVFYNNLGPDGFKLTEDILNFDALLLDNLKFTEITQSTDITQNTEFQVQPNPVLDICFLETKSKENVNIEIVDLNGIIQLSFFGKTNKDKIDLSSLNSGIYFVKFINSEHVLAVHKLLKL